MELFQAKGEIRFVKFKNSAKVGLAGYFVITEDDINVLFRLMKFYTEALGELIAKAEGEIPCDDENSLNT